VGQPREGSRHCRRRHAAALATPPPRPVDLPDPATHWPRPGAGAGRPADAAGNRILATRNRGLLRDLLPEPPAVPAPIGIDDHGGEISLFEVPDPAVALDGDGSAPAAVLDRKATYLSALEQAEQFFKAATTAGTATMPVHLFYGLSQAGRAIVAAAANAGSDWRLSDHGITCRGIDGSFPQPSSPAPVAYLVHLRDLGPRRAAVAAVGAATVVTASFLFVVYLAGSPSSLPSAYTSCCESGFGSARH
jgi:hypothetical protein